MFVVFTLNGPIQPMDRGFLFEDPLEEWLAEHGGGEVVGGGTSMGDEGGALAIDAVAGELLEGMA